MIKKLQPREFQEGDLVLNFFYEFLEKIEASVYLIMKAHM
jgi:hypothetical protein